MDLVEATNMTYVKYREGADTTGHNYCGKADVCLSEDVLCMTTFSLIFGKEIEKAGSTTFNMLNAGGAEYCLRVNSNECVFWKLDGATAFLHTGCPYEFVSNCPHFPGGACLDNKSGTDIQVDTLVRYIEIRNGTDNHQNKLSFLKRIRSYWRTEADVRGSFRKSNLILIFGENPFAFIYWVLCCAYYFKNGGVFKTTETADFIYISRRAGSSFVSLHRVDIEANCYYKEAVSFFSAVNSFVSAIENNGVDSKTAENFIFACKNMPLFSDFGNIEQYISI